MGKNIKGATLIEIVVTLLLVAIILAFIGSFFLSSGKYFDRTQTGNEDKYIGDSISELIENTIRFAGKIEIIEDNETPKYSNVLSFKDNKLALKNENITSDNIYSDSFYENRKASYNVSSLSDTSIKIEVNVLNDDNETVYTATSVIDFPNLNLNSNIIEISEDSIQNAKISYEESEITINQNTSSELIPGTTVMVNSVWPDSSEFFDANGYPKGVAFTKGTTFEYNGKYYLIAQDVSALYISNGDPTPENAIATGWYKYVLVDISSDTVYEYGVDDWNSINIKRGEKVLKDGKYYVYNADGFWKDIPPGNNYVEIQYPLP